MYKKDPAAATPSHLAKVSPSAVTPSPPLLFFSGRPRLDSHNRASPSPSHRCRHRHLVVAVVAISSSSSPPVCSSSPAVHDSTVYSRAAAAMSHHRRLAVAVIVSPSPSSSSRRHFHS
ncbi:hypothetical protein ACLOJK_041124 [Asimina triloba]